jgi:hypothetical protein
VVLGNTRTVRRFPQIAVELRSLIPSSHDLIEGHAFPTSAANGTLSNLRVEARMLWALSLDFYLDMYLEAECEHNSPFQCG